MPRRQPAPRPARPQRAAPQRWRRAFLAALAQHGNKTLAAEQAQVDRATVYAERARDDAFRQAWDAALDEAADRLEAEALRRAKDGLMRKKFTAKGEPILDPATGEQYVEHEFSDTLLIFLLKGARPNKYRERYDVQAAAVAQLQIVEEIVDGGVERPPHPPA